MKQVDAHWRHRSVTHHLCNVAILICAVDEFSRVTDTKMRGEETSLNCHPRVQLLDGALTFCLAHIIAVDVRNIDETNK